MTTKWKNKINSEQIEGFQIFDDSYFKDCIDYLAQGTTSKGFADSIRDIFEYITCPIFRFDNLVDNVLKEFIKTTNRIPCPDLSTGQKNANRSNAPIVYNNNLDTDTLYNINNIISNHPWISNPTIANNIMYIYLHAIESQTATSSLSFENKSIEILSKYQTNGGKFSNSKIEDFNANFNDALKNQSIITSIMNNNIGNDIKIGLFQNVIGNDVSKLFPITSKIIEQIKSQIEKVSSPNPDSNIQISYISDPIKESTVNIIISNHVNWIVNQTIANNVLYYYLNSLSSEFGTKPTSEQLIKFNNDFNSSLYEQNIINLLLTVSKNENDLNMPDKNLIGQIKNNICTNLNADDINSSAKIIKAELYNLLKIPLILYITYNFYYSFFYNNNYGNPEVYLNDWRTNFYNMAGFNGYTDDEIEYQTILGYLVNLITKPFQLLYHYIFKNLYNWGHKPTSFANNSMGVFFLLYIANFRILGFGGGYIFKLIKGLFGISSLKNDMIYGFLYGISYLIIMFFLIKWVITYWFKPRTIFPLLTLGLFSIFKKFFTILIRIIISTMSVEIATLICIFYILFYLFFAMKYGGIRGSVVDSIKYMNKTLVDSKSENNNFIDKIFIFLYNSMIELTCLFIIIISFADAGKIDSKSPVHVWFININIILLVLVISFIIKEFKKSFAPKLNISNLVMGLFGGNKKKPESTTVNTPGAGAAPSAAPGLASTPLSAAQVVSKGIAAPLSGISAGIAAPLAAPLSAAQVVSRGPPQYAEQEQQKQLLQLLEQQKQQYVQQNKYTPQQQQQYTEEKEKEIKNDKKQESAFGTGDVETKLQSVSDFITSFT
jgi:hypothetical protein